MIRTRTEGKINRKKNENKNILRKRNSEKNNNWDQENINTNMKEWKREKDTKNKNRKR